MKYKPKKKQLVMDMSLIPQSPIELFKKWSMEKEFSVVHQPELLYLYRYRGSKPSGNVKIERFDERGFVWKQNEEITREISERITRGCIECLKGSI